MHFNIQQKYFNLIKAGLKLAEGRINKPKFNNLKIGDKISFSPNGNNKDLIRARVTALNRYIDFKEMLSIKNELTALLPGIHSVTDGIKLYESFGDYKTAQFEFGVISIHFDILE